MLKKKKDREKEKKSNKKKRSKRKVVKECERRLLQKEILMEVEKKQGEGVGGLKEERSQKIRNLKIKD